MIKKMIASLLAGMITLCSSATMVYSVDAATNGSSDSVVYGDFDNDKTLTFFDLCLARRQLISPAAQVIDAKACDLNGDGVYSLADAVQLQQFLLGSRKTFSRSEIESGTTTATTSATTTSSTTSTSTSTTETTTTESTSTSTTVTTTETTSSETTTTTERPYFIDDYNWEKDTVYRVNYDIDKALIMILKSGLTSNWIPQYYIADGYIFFDRMMGFFDFHLIEASKYGLRYENSLGDCYVITPIETSSINATVSWTYSANGTLFIKEFNSTEYGPSLCYVGDDISTRAENHFDITPYSLLSLDFVQHYAPDGYTLPNGIYISPEEYPDL